MYLQVGLQINNHKGKCRFLYLARRSLKLIEGFRVFDWGAEGGLL